MHYRNSDNAIAHVLDDPRGAIGLQGKRLVSAIGMMGCTAPTSGRGRGQHPFSPVVQFLRFMPFQHAHAERYAAPHSEPKQRKRSHLIRKYARPRGWTSRSFVNKTPRTGIKLWAVSHTISRSTTNTTTVTAKPRGENWRRKFKSSYSRFTEALQLCERYSVSANVPSVDSISLMMRQFWAVSGRWAAP